MEDRRTMNMDLARNIITATAEKERLNDWDRDQLRWVARSLDSLENPDSLEDEDHDHSWITDYAARKQTCHDCGKAEWLPGKLSYEVTLNDRSYFVSGFDPDEAIGTALAMAKTDGFGAEVNEGRGYAVTARRVDDRLEYLRSQIRAESISMLETMELESLADAIDKGDVELLQWAGVPENSETDEALEQYANPVETVTIVDIPVTFHAHYENGQIIKFVLMPKESDAGYFGHYAARSQIWDGPEIDLTVDGEFWTAVSEHLENQNLPEGEFIATWEG